MQLKTLFAIGLLLSFSGIARSDCDPSLQPSYTTRSGMSLAQINSCGWGSVINSNFNILDSSICLQGGINTFTGFNSYSGSTTFVANVNISSSVSILNNTGISGQFLTSGGVGSVPSWTTASGGGGGITVSPQYQVPVYSNSGSTNVVTGFQNLTNNGSTVTIIGQQVITSTTNPVAITINTNEANALDVRWDGNLTGQLTQMVPGFFKCTQEAQGVSAYADCVASYSWARDVPLANGVLQGGEQRVTGQGSAPQYLGDRVVTQWVGSALQSGTTSQIAGLQVDVFITSGDATTPISTGTAIALSLPKWTGSGAPGHAWSLYAASTQPYFIDGSVGIGTPAPQAALQLNVTTGTQYALIVSTSPYLDYGPGSDKYILRLSTDSILTMNPGLELKPTGEIKITRTDAPSSTLDQALHVDYERAVTGSAGTRMSGIYSFVKSTGIPSSITNVAVAGYMEVNDTSSGTASAIGLEGKALGKGLGPTYTGIVGRGEWRSDLAGGTTSTIYALNLVTAITDGSLNPLSTGTLKILNIASPTGQGASSQTWSLYGASTYSYFMDGRVGIGNSAPPAQLTVQSLVDTQYALIVGTVTALNGAMPARNYVLSVTTDGITAVKTITFPDGTTQTSAASGTGGGGYAVQPATVAFNLAQGVTGSTFSFIGPSQSSVTYGLTVGSLTVNGTGNMSVTENGLTGQVLLSTPTSVTANNFALYATSATLIPGTLVAGSNITLSQSGTALTIASSGSGSGTIPILTQYQVPFLASVSSNVLTSSANFTNNGSTITMSGIQTWSEVNVTTQTASSVLFDYTSSSMTVSSMTVISSFFPPSVTLTTIRARIPVAAGEMLFCNNCAAASFCVSTGTVVGSYAAVSSSKTATCN